MLNDGKATNGVLTNFLKACMKTGAELLPTLEFIKAKSGIVLRDWYMNPTATKIKRAVFPKVERNAIGVRSMLIKDSINVFFPFCRDSEYYENALVVKMDDGSTLMILESDAETRRGSFSKLYPTLEFPSYAQAKKTCTSTIFMGVKDVLVQR